MPKLKTMFKKHQWVYLSFVFVLCTLLFLFAGQIRTQAKDLGFGPALIDTGNCIIGSAPCNPSSAQEVYLFQPGEGSVTALQATAQLVDSMYTNPPTSAVVWAYDQYYRIKNQELLAVYAQSSSNSSFYFPGLGYNLLMPMLGLWQWSRNTVYLFYVVIVIFLAAVILFRQRLGGQAFITLSNSLPSLVLSLVLVTFSYPIAGFFVDLIFIGSNVAQGLLITSPGAPGFEFMNNKHLGLKGQVNDDIYYLQPDDPYVSIWAIWGTSKAEIFPDDCIADPDKPCMSNILPSMDENVGVLSFVGKVLDVGETVVSGLAGTPFGNSMLNLILGIIALMSMVRLFFALLKNYVILILSPVYLPWMFLLAAIPSKTKSSITNALKPLAAASLSFVAVYVLFLIMIIIGRSAEINSALFKDIGQFTFVPPLLGYNADSTAVLDQTVTRSIIIFILYLGAPTIPGMINELFQVPNSSQLASQIGQNASQGSKIMFSGIQKGVKSIPWSHKESQDDE